MPIIEQVCDINSKAGIMPIIVNDRIDQYKIRDFKRITSIAVGRPFIAHPRPKTQSPQRTALKRIVGPHGGPLPGHTYRPISFITVIALGNFNILQRVRRNQVKAPIQAGDTFQFNTAGAHLPRLNLILEIVGIRRQDILPGEIVSGQSDSAVPTGRLVFKADFILLARHGLKGYTMDIGSQRRNKRFRIAEIGCQAKVKKMH